MVSLKWNSLQHQPWWEKMGNLGSSFPRNIDMWREILEFGGKFCLFVHKNTIQIGENWACFPGNKHFFILWHQRDWPVSYPGVMCPGQELQITLLRSFLFSAHVVFRIEMLRRNSSLPGLPDHTFPGLKHGRTDHTIKSTEYWSMATVHGVNQLPLYYVITLMLNSVISRNDKFCPGPWTLESCGARFLAPRPRIPPLSYAPTRTGPKNSKFYGPDPGLTRLYFPRTGPDRNNLASNWN